VEGAAAVGADAYDDWDWMRRAFSPELATEVDVVAEAEVARTVSAANPTRCELPSNVTSAFSLAQVRFAALKRANITLSKRGMEKLACAPEIRRTMAFPSVTFE
jgi:hypothetical protein